VEPAPEPNPTPNPATTSAPTSGGAEMVLAGVPEGYRCAGQPPGDWGDLGTKISAEQCQDRCLANDHCRFAVYKTTARSCTKFHECNSPYDQKPDFAVWAKHNGGSPEMVLADVPEGQRCSGQPPSGRWGDLGTKITAQKCQDRCLAKDSCRFALYKGGSCSSFHECSPPHETKPGFQVWKKMR